MHDASFPYPAPEVARAVTACLKKRGRVTLRLAGGSMLPTIWPGCEVEVLRCTQAELRTGDVALTRAADRLLLHRVVAHTPDGIRTQGDAHAFVDAIAQSEVLGRVQGIAIGRHQLKWVPQPLSRWLRCTYLRVLPVVRPLWRIYRANPMHKRWSDLGG